MARRKRGRAVNGWLVLDKPRGMTSTHAVNVVKRLFDARKAGHAGTLDPLATGVLPIAFGEATKTMNYAVDSHKGYAFAVRWGRETTTDDAEGEVVETATARPTVADIETVLPQFIGEISQVPPRFSAIKIDGQRAYDLARDGQEVEIAARVVNVDDLRLTDVPDDDHAVFAADCGKGTYVRAIARDMGRKIGCFGHIVQLRRTRVGAFSLDESVELAAIEEAAEAMADGEDVPTALARMFIQPVASALRELDELRLGPNDVGRVKRGQPVIIRGRDVPVAQDAVYATSKGEVVALGEISQGSFVPTRVFNL